MLCRLGAVFLRAVDLRVTDVVTLHAVGLDVEEDRPLAGADALQRLRETEDPIDKLRERLGLSDEELEEVDREVTKIVEDSVEFAKNGTDPAPEDALKNVYA